MMPFFFVMVNFAWAVVFFVGAVVLGVVLGWNASWKDRAMIAAAAVLVGIAVGFCMMGQYWFDEARADPDVRSYGDLVEESLHEPRLEQVCRAVMAKVPEVAGVAGREQDAALDVVSCRIDTTFAARNAGFRARPPEILREVTMVYAVPPGAGAATGPEPAEEPQPSAAAPPQRLYFQLEPYPWHVVRVYRKTLMSGELREDVVWDETLERQRSLAGSSPR